MLAIAYSESSCGVNILGDKGRSLGVMQVQASTAKWIATKVKSLAYLKYISNKRLETMLLLDDKLNIQIATELFEYHRKRHGYFGAVSRFNGGSNNRTYYRKVERTKRWIVKRRLNTGLNVSYAIKSLSQLLKQTSIAYHVYHWLVGM